ncbi:MAG: ribonucleotide reductase N-terminal alpha domain-containing protein, partial [Myxococcota bacterium]|nr:ribonucleotide reductase N-terminal alpha domain-containing protein [Myxococcota bacterium]
MPPLSPNAQRVLEARYLIRDPEGALVEDWEGLCRRVAAGVAAAEKEFGGEVGRWEQAFFAAIERREFLPNSPTLMNAGTRLGQLAACFVLPIEDDLDSIFDA